MKYIRILTRDDKARTGILEPDNTINLIESDIFNDPLPTGETLTLNDVKHYLPPVDPPNIFAIGLNYREHALETKAQIPQAPVIFIKASTSLSAHRWPILLPKPAPDEVDFEAELVIVIGKKAKHITAQQAPDFIFGYTCGNDVSARDCQKRIDRQWARGKSFDTFAPIGPVIATGLDPNNLRIRSFLNGSCMQDSTTADLIFPVNEIVSYLSQNFTLLPGTLIFTGSPPGVGVARKPPVFLRPGDQIIVDIEGIGSLNNHVQKE
jgi:2-keto-4-pentenoate hydratase/2-oxohepta-3-ene-1,7-dioic acid hydratase in catechol pathway